MIHFVVYQYCIVHNKKNVLHLKVIIQFVLWYYCLQLLQMCPYYEDNINLITFHLFKPQTKYTGDKQERWFCIYENECHRFDIYY